MSTILDAAQDLIRQLNSPAVSHSVWVQTSVDPETQEFVQVIKVSIRPSWKNKIKVPDACKGFKVVQEPWPKGS